MSNTKADDLPYQELLEVRQSSIHHRGVFALCDLKAGQRLIQYTGERITKKESERRGLALIEEAKQTGGAAVYIFNLNSRYDLDGANCETPAKYMNHSCDPNCEVFVEKGQIWVYAKRDIAKDEELCYNYGFGIDTWEDHPCLCGTDRCVGFIVSEDEWPKLKRRLRALKKSAAEHRARQGGKAR